MRPFEDFGLLDAHKSYVKETGHEISLKQYRNFVKDYFTLASDYVVETGFYFPLGRFGHIYIDKKTSALVQHNRQIKSIKKIDFKATKEQNKPIRFTNPHTNGAYYSIKLHKRDFKGKSLYNFIFCRAFKRKFAKHILTNSKNLMY